MKTRHLLLTLLLALLVPWAANAQQTTKTVHQGTNTSRGVPMYAFYFDEFTKSQHVIPAADLENMSGGTITSITYYYTTSSTSSTPYTTATQSHVSINLYITEVESASISSLMDFSSYTPAYTGYITYETDGTVAITLDHSYIYGGGNLMIGVENPTKGGNGNYDNVYFYGETGTQGASTYSNNSNSASSITYQYSNTSNFLPYTTFTYTPAATPTSAPGVTTSETIADLTNVSVKLGGTITDMGGANSVQAGICYSTTSEPTTSDGHVQSGCMSTGAYTRNITGLLPSTKYYYRAYAYNSANSLADPTYGDIYSFTTAGNITITQPANGEIRVSVAGGTPTTSSTYALPGESVTLTATPVNGYSLDCWTVSGVTGTTSGNTYTFTMPSNSVSATASIIPTSGGTGTTTVWAKTTSISTSENYLIGAVSGSDIYLVLNYSPNTNNHYYYESPDYDYWGYTAKATLDASGHVTGCTGNATDLQYAQWKFSAETGGKITSQYETNEYLYGTTSSSYTDLYVTTSSTTWTYSNDKLSYSSSNYLYLNSSRYIQKGTATTASTVYLYKQTEMTSYAITATASPAEGGTVAGSDYYASGSTCTLTATPAFGYEFVSWTEGGEVVSLDAAYTFTVSGARTLIANFESQGSCIKPTDLAQVPETQAAHQAQLSWTENSGATQWQVVYSTDSEFNPDDATPIDVNENPATIPGLSQATTYYARVRAICGQNSQSGWSSQATFSTISGRQAPTVSYDPATLTADEVTVTWTGVATNVNHQSYDLYYSTNSVMPTTLDPTTFIVGLTGNSHPLTGLTGDTKYYVWVRDNCGDDGLSDWSTPESFTTACDAKTVDADHEFFQSFDDTNFPNCWDNPSELISGSTRQWIRYSGTNHTTGGSGSAYSGYYGPIYLMMPDLTIANGTTDVKLNFWARLDYTSDYDGTTAKSSVVLIDGNTETELWTYDDVANITDLEDLWKDYSINLSAYKGQTISLAFKYVGTNDHGWYIDDVEVAFDPTCLPVGTLANATEVKSRTAKLSWTLTDDTQSSWDVAVKAASDEDFIIRENAANTNVGFVLTGLTPSTSYTVKVRANCGAEDGTGAWSNTITFTTDVACPAPTNVTASNVTKNSAEISWEGDAASFNIRYREYVVPTGTLYDFESGMGEWTTIDADGDGYDWVLGSQTQGVYLYGEDLSGAGYNSSSDLMASGSYRNTSSSGEELYPDNYLVSPMVTLGGTISFYACGTDDDYYAEHFGVFVSTNSNNNPDDFVMVNEWTATSTSYTQYSADLSAYSGKGYVAIRHFDCSDQFVLRVDNITIADPVTEPWTLIEDVTSPQPIPELTAETTYEVQVQAVCGGIDGESDWTTSITFTTLSNCAAPTELNAAVTASSATLSWSGAQESYNVKYAKLVPGEAVTTTEDFTGDYELASHSGNGVLPTGWERYLTSSSGYLPHVSNNSTLGTSYDITGMDEAGGTEQFLYMGSRSIAILPQYENITAVSFQYAYESDNTNNGVVTVGYCTENTGTSTFTPLTNNGDSFTPAITTLQTVDLTEEAIALINDNNGYLAFKWTGSSYGVGIDNIVITSRSLAPGEWVNRIEVTSPLPIEGLEMNTKYEWQVQGINAGCDGGVTDWSEATFTTPYPTFTRVINGYGNSDGGYVLIASPLADDVNPTKVTNMIASTAADYDLYYFDQAEDSEWRNYKAETFNLENGKGYLYANKNDVTLTFIGTPYSGEGEIDLTYDNTVEFPGLNLVGNPFATTATPNMAYYRLNSDGAAMNTEAYTEGTAVEMIEGIFVLATGTDQSVKFTPGNGAKHSQLNLNLSQGNNLVDNAIVRFDGGSTLEKFSFRQGSTKVFITENDKDYAVVSAGHVGEIPVSFKAEKNGSYNLSFTSQEVSFSYLHLIDNLTGNDVDLLANPSYNFNAQTTDYASRFRLMFATGSSVDGDNFAFINTMGNLSIFGIEGTATVQVIDLLGRVLSSETFSGSYEKKLNVAPGVYMIRLINGDDVKVQKIVVR